MNWYRLLKLAQDIEYMPWKDPNNMSQDEYEENRYLTQPSNKEDTIDMNNEALQIFGVDRLTWGLQITQIALSEGVVVGSLATGWSDSKDSDGYPQKAFEMHVAVKPEYRGPQSIGLKLIEQGIQQYKQERQIFESQGLDTIFKTNINNPRLLDFVKRRYQSRYQVNIEPKKNRPDGFEATVSTGHL